ncbi:MAG: Coenzyme F420 hydrogenase/dehydrogenase, beta subunit C-terminal domain [Syntrophaceae bacterium]|nr:Coenzyme F420 hydrogenase/dehydrogenase, beta subunit C-terminal domain [Syntrophaceae bacterium]
MEVKILGQKELNQAVKDAHFCTGCGACVNLCPYQAHYRDQIVMLHPCDLKEGGCYAFCPRTPTDLEALKKKLFDPEDLTPELGAVKGFYITRAADPKVRAKAQHGGTVTTLITLALQEGLIDTAILAEEGRNLLPRETTAQDADSAQKLSRSKFVVSPNVAEFNRIAKEGGKKIGIVATPCQALALAKMRMKPLKNYAERIDQLRLVIGIFCGWALSWKGLVEVLRKKIDLSEIEGMDIPPSKYHLLQLYTKKGTIDISLDEITSSVRGACWYCPDLTAEFSDLSVGSARLPEGWEVAKGWNQVIVRTSLGQRLLNLAKNRGLLEFREVPAENLPRLKTASLGKKRTAVKNLKLRSGDPKKLFYLDPDDPVLGAMAAGS